MKNCPIVDDPSLPRDVIFVAEKDSTGCLVSWNPGYVRGNKYKKAVRIAADAADELSKRGMASTIEVRTR